MQLCWKRYHVVHLRVIFLLTLNIDFISPANVIFKLLQTGDPSLKIVHNWSLARYLFLVFSVHTTNTNISVVSLTITIKDSMKTMTLELSLVSVPKMKSY